MTQKTRPSGEEQSAESGPRKKPYRKPEFRFERVFETLALACGKIHVTQGQCHFNRKKS